MTLSFKNNNNFEFEVIRGPDTNLLNSLYLLSGGRCNLNPGFLLANSKNIATLIAMRVNISNLTVAYAVARESNRWFARRLVFPVLPQFTKESPIIEECFWHGFRSYCKKNNILIVDLNGYDSVPIRVPEIGSVIKSINRYEYVLDLKNITSEMPMSISKNHRRNILKGQRKGLTFEIRNDYEACVNHVEMIEDSMLRRRQLGQKAVSSKSPDIFYKYLKCNAGIILQARLGNLWLSSLFILRSKNNAYYHSGGTKKAGMQLGASHYLMGHAIEYLKTNDIFTFNLGGVSETDTPGLARFKEGFGAEPIELPHRTFLVGRKWMYNLVKKIRVVKS